MGEEDDELGYVVPPYNFTLHETNPRFDEAEGAHYEGTHRLGPQPAPIFDAEVRPLMGGVNEHL